MEEVDFFMHITVNLYTGRKVKRLNTNVANIDTTLMVRTRERLTVDIDKEILRNFKQVIIRKYGKLRGNMTTGVSEALELYVQRYKKD